MGAADPGAGRASSTEGGADELAAGAGSSVTAAPAGDAALASGGSATATAVSWVISSALSDSVSGARSGTSNP
jgi:hypothetical protein